MRNGDEEERLKQELTPFLIKNGVREDIEFCVLSSEDFFSSRGANLVSFLPARVLIQPNFLKLDREAALHSIKHEIGHIKYNDAVRIPLVKTVTSVAVGILLPHLLANYLRAPRPLANLISFIAQIVITEYLFLFYNRHREAVADDFSNREATDGELVGGLRTFLNFVAEKASNPLTHPDFGTRIARIKKVMNERGLSTSIDVTKTEIYKFRELQIPGIHSL